ncbi:unnamed protein product [Lathyrus sativus]|nr:unnamed protein product [Lathyrus sativus]
MWFTMPLLDVVYNASNNELLRTQTLVKSAIVQVDAAPFKHGTFNTMVLKLEGKRKLLARKTLRRLKLLQRKLKRVAMFRGN